MLEVVSVRLEGSKSDLKLGRDIGFEHSSFGIDVKDCHVLTVEIFLFLWDPKDIEFSLKFVRDFYFLLATERHHITEPEFNEILIHTDELIMRVL